MRVLYRLVLLISATVLMACQSSKTEPLPYLGPHQQLGDSTVYYRVDSFAFFNQDSQLVTAESLRGKVYVVDFFFISCPTICPVMTKHMKELYKRYQSDPRVVLMSFTLDPRHDTIPRLKRYAQKLGVSAPKWNFLYGPKVDIYSTAAKFLISASQEDDSDPLTIIHSGKFVLVDGEGHLRSYCDGTSKEEVYRLAEDIDRLLDEMADEGHD